MAGDFETWLNQIAPPDELNMAGFRPPGFDVVMRRIFTRRGPIPVAEVNAEWSQVQIELAQRAVALVVRDLHATTTKRPAITVRHDDDHGLIVTYDGGWQTSGLRSIRHPEATCEIAGNLQDEIIEDLWTPWPMCPTHETGAYAQTLGPEAVWYCRTGEHIVATIGQLAR